MTDWSFLLANEILVPSSSQLVRSPFPEYSHLCGQWGFSSKSSIVRLCGWQERHMKYQFPWSIFWTKKLPLVFDLLHFQIHYSSTTWMTETLELLDRRQPSASSILSKKSPTGPGTWLMKYEFSLLYNTYEPLSTETEDCPCCHLYCHGKPL